MSVMVRKVHRPRGVAGEAAAATAVVMTAAIEAMEGWRQRWGQ